MHLKAIFFFCKRCKVGIKLETFRKRIHPNLPLSMKYLFISIQNVVLQKSKMILVQIKQTKDNKLTISLSLTEDFKTQHPLYDLP